jgi:hypothetical protein
VPDTSLSGPCRNDAGLVGLEEQNLAESFIRVRRERDSALCSQSRQSRTLPTPARTASRSPGFLLEHRWTSQRTTSRRRAGIRRYSTVRPNAYVLPGISQ